MRTARLKVIGVPCRTVGGEQTACWFHDKITILARVGSRYLCRVVYGCKEAPFTMFVWLHKRLLRVSEYPKAKAVSNAA